MAHYAKVENGVVTQVIVADSKEWCQANLGGEWVQTSYNTHGGGKHQHLCQLMASVTVGMKTLPLG